MKTKRRVKFLFVALLGFSASAQADLMEGFDSLGGNDVLLEKARALNPETKMRIVQERVVDRRLRFEIAPEYGNVLGGDAYNKTHTVGLNAHFHITPRWSVGAKYGYAFNELRPEGEYLLQDRAATGQAVVPEIDFPKSQWLATLNWYPIYGKMNLYDLGVAHFDVYALLGGGEIELRSGPVPTYTGGGGIGFWFSRHVTTRFELRYKTYQATRYNGPEQMDTTVASIQVGYLL